MEIKILIILSIVLVTAIGIYNTIFLYRLSPKNITKNGIIDNSTQLIVNALNHERIKRNKKEENIDKRIEQHFQKENANNPFNNKQKGKQFIFTHIKSPNTLRVKEIELLLSNIDNLSEDVQKEQWGIIAKLATKYSQYSIFDSRNLVTKEENMGDRIDKILSDDIEVDVKINEPTGEQIAKSIRDSIDNFINFTSGKNIIEAI